MESTWWRLKWFGSWVAACVAALLAYFSGFELLEKFVHTSDDNHEAANIFVVSLALIVIVLAFWRQWITIRKEKYANITHHLHHIFHQIRDLNTFIHLREPVNGTQREYEDFTRDCRIIFGRILDQLNSIFTSITSTHCRATLKLTYEKNDTIYMYNFARDQATKQAIATTDMDRAGADHDPLSLNEHFARIFHSTTVWHYVSNNLPREPGFKCTSFTAYNPNYQNEAPASFWSKKSWPLPYKSALLTVIRQGSIDDLHNQLKPEVLGFLTVDSESRGIFEERWDVPIVFAVADALYTPVRAFLDAQNRAPKDVEK